MVFFICKVRLAQQNNLTLDTARVGDSYAMDVPCESGTLSARVVHDDQARPSALKSY